MQISPGRILHLLSLSLANFLFVGYLLSPGSCPRYLQMIPPDDSPVSPIVIATICHTLL